MRVCNTCTTMTRYFSTIWEIALSGHGGGGDVIPQQYSFHSTQHLMDQHNNIMYYQNESDKKYFTFWTVFLAPSQTPTTTLKSRVDPPPSPANTHHKKIH